MLKLALLSCPHGNSQGSSSADDDASLKLRDYLSSGFVQRTSANTGKHRYPDFQAVLCPALFRSILIQFEVGRLSKMSHRDDTYPKPMVGRE